jgi:hypothetical protein
MGNYAKKAQAQEKIHLLRSRIEDLGGWYSETYQFMY